MNNTSRDKKSFFEKLTGTVRIEDQDAMEPARSIPLERKQDYAEVDEEESEGQLTVDVHQTPNEIVIKTMVAGVKPEDLDVSISRDMVTIRGKREGDRSISKENYFFQELYWGSFSRTIMLPQEVQVDEAEAVEKHGLLIIRLPKVNKEKHTKLRVKTI